MHKDNPDMPPMLGHVREYLAKTKSDGDSTFCPFLVLAVSARRFPAARLHADGSKGADLLLHPGCEWRQPVSARMPRRELEGVCGARM